MVEFIVGIRAAILSTWSCARTQWPSGSMERRTFLQMVALGNLALAIARFILGSTDGKKFKTALIGSGWWGKNILREAISSGRCKIVGLADVDANVLEVSAEQVTDLNGDAPKMYRDYRELLEKEKPEVVIV